MLFFENKNVMPYTLLGVLCLHSEPILRASGKKPGFMFKIMCLHWLLDNTTILIFFTPYPL